MNDELDLMRRIVDYHDHISVPPLLVADDLQRGRQRVRRRRALVAGGTAVALASVVAVVSLITAGGPPDRPQPAGPPTTPSTFEPVPGNPGLDGPLVAPQSILDVQELGFHVEGVPTLSVTLTPDRQELEVAVENSTFAVRVHYQGAGPGLSASDQPRQEVSINGLPGTFVERFDGTSHLAYVTWEYAPDSWAAVWRSDDTSMPARRAQVLSIAEAIRPGGETVRVPFRVGAAAAPVLGGDAVAEVDIPRGRDFWHVSFESGIGITGHRAASGSGSPCRPPKTSSELAEPFTHRGYAGCVRGVGDDQSLISAVSLQVDGAEYTVHHGGDPLTGYEVEDLKRLLAAITVAPSDDRATWFDLRTALGG